MKEWVESTRLPSNDRCQSPVGTLLAVKRGSGPESAAVVVDCSQMLPTNDLRATAGRQSSIEVDDTNAGYPTVWQLQRRFGGRLDSIC